MLAPGHGAGGNDGGAKNLLACKGECDADAQCAEGLKCFQREKGEPIPGCWGPGEGKTWDYCYDPKAPMRSPPPPPPRVPGAMCQCKRPATESFALCDMTQRTSRADASSASGRNIGYRHYWTAGDDEPCQMQAQVGKDGIITMVDYIEGPTATLAGTAMQSSQHGGYKPDRATDQLSYTYTHTENKATANTWWQLDLGARRAVGSFVIKGRDDGCASRLFEDNTGCRWEHRKEAETTPIVGFKVGVSNTSCLSGGRGCGGHICAHVMTPTEDHLHEYTVVCDPPVVGKYAYVLLHGKSRILSLTEVEIRAPDAKTRGRLGSVEYKPNAPVTFPVQWQGGKFPKASTRPHSRCMCA